MKVILHTECKNYDKVHLALAVRILEGTSAKTTYAIAEMKVMYSVHLLGSGRHRHDLLRPDGLLLL